MTTIRQIERTWSAKQYGRLCRELISIRAEAFFRLELEHGPAAAAALGMIRLDELGHAHVPLYGQFLRTLLAAQEADGGWGDLTTSALCLRALTCGEGAGPAIERGLAFFAHLQQPQGVWPRVPIRRMPEDAYLSAFVLYQLGDRADFQQAVRFADALDWFERNEASLDDETRQLWRRAGLRCRVPVDHRVAVATWPRVA